MSFTRWPLTNEDYGRLRYRDISRIATGLTIAAFVVAYANDSAGAALLGVVSGVAAFFCWLESDY